MNTEQNSYHRTLERQLKKALGRNYVPTPELDALLRMVSDSYAHYEDDRSMLERSIDLSSKELLEQHERVMKQKGVLERTIANLRSTRIELAASQELAHLSVALQESNEELNAQREELASTIEELRNAQSQLVHAEKMSSLGQLTAGIAHEINNPVNFIYVGIQALAPLMEDAFAIFDEVGALGTNASKVQETAINALIARNTNKGFLQELKEDINYMLESVKIGAERTSEIVKGLRMFARTDTDEFQYADVRELLEATMLIMGNKMKDRIQLHKEYAEAPPIPCFPGQLNQVFINLVSNAIDAIQNKGNVWISIENFPDKILMSFKDDGPGIPDHILGKVFDPFFSTKDVGKGTGLGLSISHGIIEKHNGRIWVESTQGEGTAFFIELPKYPSYLKEGQS